jgi:choline-sulfatase
VSDPKYADVIRDHAKWLPKINLPPAPGSASRILVKENGVWMWEGVPIVPAELEK